MSRTINANYPSNLVGASVRPVEDVRPLTGRGNYLADIELSGALAVGFARSPHAHALIKSIDLSRAQASAQVHAIVTGAQLIGAVEPLRVEYDRNAAPNHKSCDWPVLAHKKVRFVGEAVAAVVARDRYSAEDAASLIDVEYEPLPVVSDAGKALESGAPLLHEQWADNCMHSAVFEAGDVGRVFETADCIVTGLFTTGRQVALPIEGRGCLASYDSATDSLTVWSSTQFPHTLRSAIAVKLGMSERLIRVIAPDIGGGFALKVFVYPEEMVVPFLARHLKRPVRWIEDRREHLTSATHSRQQVINGKLALSKDGRILGLLGNVLSDAGAYSAYPWGSAYEGFHTSLCLPGPYKVPAYRCDVRIAVTNKAPTGVYRGVGLPHAVLVMERLLDLGAQKLGLDPAELRFRNLNSTKELPYTTIVGERIESGSHQECLLKALDIIDYQSFRQEQKRLRHEKRFLGIGMSLFVYDSAPSSQALAAAGIQSSTYDSATVRIDRSGTATILVSTKPSGQRHETIFAQLAAAELGLSIHEIKVVHGDTNATPSGSGTFGDRGAVTGGGAVIVASRKVRDKILRTASFFTEIPSEQLELIQGFVRNKANAMNLMPIKEVARKLMEPGAALPAGVEPGLEATAAYDPPVPSTHPNGAHVCIVEVDMETGGVKILRYVAVEDCGTMINPGVVKGQIEGGVAQGIGSALYEQIFYDANGQILTGSLLDYIVPTGADLPQIEVAHLETPSPHTLGGFKGVGIGGASSPPGAIANAVSDALMSFGVEVSEIPLTPERLIKLLSIRKKDDARPAI